MFDPLFSSPPGIPIKCRLAHFMFAHGLKYWFHFFNVSDVLIGRVPLFYLPDHLFVLLHHCLPVARPVRAGLSSAYRSAAALQSSESPRVSRRVPGH